MTDSVYRVFEVIGTSAKSWGRRGDVRDQLASKSLRDLRFAESSSRTW